MDLGGNRSRVCSSDDDIAQTSALNCSTAQLLDCSTAQLLNCSTAQLLNCSTAQLLNCSTARLFKYSTAQLLDGHYRPSPARRCTVENLGGSAWEVSLTISRKATATGPLKIQRQKSRDAVAVQRGCLKSFYLECQTKSPYSFCRLIDKLASLQQLMNRKKL